MGIANFIKFDENKTINAVLYISKNLKRSDLHKIFKVLYFADREHLAEYGRPITGDNYIAMSDGPVPSKLYDILKSIRGDSYFIDEKFSSLISFTSRDIIEATKEPNLKKLSRTDLDHINKSLSLYGDLSWDEVKEKSHDYAWRSTASNNRISFENIIRESGSDKDDFIGYVNEQNQLNCICD